MVRCRRLQIFAVVLFWEILQVRKEPVKLVVIVVALMMLWHFVRDGVLEYTYHSLASRHLENNLPCPWFWLWPWKPSLYL